MVVTRKKPFFTTGVPYKRCILHVVSLSLEESFNYVQTAWEEDSTGTHDFYLLIFKEDAKALEFLGQSDKAEDLENIAVLSGDPNNTEVGNVEYAFDFDIIVGCFLFQTFTFRTIFKVGKELGKRQILTVARWLYGRGDPKERC